MQERLAKLDGGVAVVNVGAPTETEMKEKKDRFEDALKKGDPFAMELREKANRLVDNIRVVTGSNHSCQ